MNALDQTDAKNITVFPEKTYTFLELEVSEEKLEDNMIFVIKRQHAVLAVQIIYPVPTSQYRIGEIKFDVTWSYFKRQTAKMTSEFVFFSSNPSLNHIKIEKCLLLIATNTNTFTLLFNELTRDGKSFIFAVCCLTYDHVTSNLISLIIPFALVGYEIGYSQRGPYYHLISNARSWNNF